MNLTITYPKTHEAWSGGNEFGAGSISEVYDTPAKILIPDSNGSLTPCNYQQWFWADDSGVGSGNLYVPSGKTINPATLVVVGEKLFESKNDESGILHSFIRNLMSNPPIGVRFIRYDGVEKTTLPRDCWNIFGIKISKKKQIRFIHRFSLCNADD